MSNPWLALDVGADPAERISQVGRAHERFLTGDQLGLDLYHDDQNPVTVRAELSRLRRILGPALLDSRPYRLRVDLDADFLTVGRLRESGLVDEALSAYAGPLLPPTRREWRGCAAWSTVRCVLPCSRPATCGWCRRGSGPRGAPAGDVTPAAAELIRSLRGT